jgi:hypothetical protein
LLRVLRGGAFWNDHQNVRCASRNRNNARNLNDNYGMRVVLAGCTYFLRRQNCPAGCGMTLPGRGEIWRSLFLAAPGPGRAYSNCPTPWAPRSGAGHLSYHERQQ